MPSPYQMRNQRHWWQGVRISGGVHVLFIGSALLLAALAAAFSLPAASDSRRQIELQVVAKSPGEGDLQISLAGEDSVPAGVDAEALVRALAEPEFEPADQQIGEVRLEEMLLSVVAAAERRSEAENLEQLESLTNRLNVVSSEQGVKDVGAEVNKLIGTAPRADRPAAALVAGEFDFNTAQMHDVKRERDEQGQWRYTAILLDAAGRTRESPLSVEEGESTYRVMQLIKGNPLLERVYRGVVMGVMDKMMRESR